MRTKVAVIIGSVREGRFGPVIAGWFAELAKARDDVEVEVADVAEGRTAFAAAVGRADAFVVVTPEYNHGYPGALKEAVDSVHAAWTAKPVALVTYGGISGGLRAAEQLRQVFASLHAVTIRETVSFRDAHSRFTPQGVPVDPGADEAAEKLLTHLLWWATALRTARDAAPYPG
ncbi:NADPH-dependent FMN reductase [Actinokineospora pegani]|uniref:NADPH-dependent FMN reductase n=1 Tax=Actinokineospora pegani TaxID=2654637 RepID=UPI0012EA68F6|nr:NADPH-dependent FMN reductase [Actinokineospora pegani]